MLRLNMRTTQPMIGMHTQLGKLEAHMTPAKLHTENRQARSNAHWTQPSLDIDTYPSRHSYGYTNHTDFAQQYGQQGISDVQAGDSEATQQAWDNIDNGGVPGRHPVIEHYVSKLDQEISKQRYLVAEAIPDPQITYIPIKAEGEPTPGDVTEQIDTQAFAETNFTPGQVEVYMQQKPDVRRWVTEGKYDIYA